MLEGRHVELRGARELRVDAIAAAAVERFAARLLADLSTGCVRWMGATNGDGYGIVRVAPDRLVLAHRLAIALADGICPGDRVGGHTCGDRRCCRREHLELITPEENTPGIYGIIPPRPRDDDLRADEIPF